MDNVLGCAIAVRVVVVEARETGRHNLMKKPTKAQRQKVFHALAFLVCSGADIFRDYQTGQYAEVGKDIITLTKKIQKEMKQCRN